MNKILCAAVAACVATPVFGVALVDVNIWADDFCLGDYAALDFGAQCYWCQGGGDLPPGNCVAEYAGCSSDAREILVPVGQTVSPVNSDGWNDYLCTASGWIMTRSRADCYYGEYFDMAPYTCVECPTVISVGPDGAADRIPGLTDVLGGRPDITECYLVAGQYLDDTGVYELLDKCYWQ